MYISIAVGYQIIRRGEKGSQSRRGEKGSQSRRGEKGSQSRRGEKGSQSRRGEKVPINQFNYSTFRCLSQPGFQTPFVMLIVMFNSLR